MSADLMVAAVEIPNDRQPDWGAARKHLESLPDREVVRVVLFVEHGEVVDDDTPLVEVTEQYGFVADEARDRLDTALTECELGWGGGVRGMTVLALVANTILVAADRTDGDPVPEVDHLLMFLRSGLARAAGFLTR